jgi:hypothetical protein
MDVIIVSRLRPSCIAHATDWWAYIAQSDACVLAAQYARQTQTPAVKSPGALADSLRGTLGTIPETRIYRDDNTNAITAVTVTVGSGDNAVTVTYFADQLMCLAFKIIVEQNGANASPFELH